MPFPDVKFSRRPLHFIYLCDCSGSMAAQGKMESLNQAIRQSLPAMADAARDNPEVDVFVRAVSFASQARWHLGKPTPVQNLHQQWQDLKVQPQGLTSMGEAMRLLADAMRTPPMEQRALPPVLVLISDGSATDDYEAGLQVLMREPWARKAVRLAIAIGYDANLEDLQKFIDPEFNTTGGEAKLNGSGQMPIPLKPLQVDSARLLARYMQWASSAVLNAVSRPLTEFGQLSPSRHVNIPAVPMPMSEGMDAGSDIIEVSW